jgi:hypothetical protein
MDPRLRCRLRFVAGRDSIQMSVGTPPRLWMMGRVRPQCSCHARAYGVYHDSGGRAVTGPRTVCLAHLRPAAVVGKSWHVEIRCRTYASELQLCCKCSGVGDRRLPWIRGLKHGPPLENQKKKLSSMMRSTVSSARRKYPVNLGKRGNKKVLANPVLEENNCAVKSPSDLWGPAQRS